MFIELALGALVVLLVLSMVLFLRSQKALRVLREAQHSEQLFLQTENARLKQIEQSHLSELEVLNSKLLTCEGERQQHQQARIELSTKLEAAEKVIQAEQTLLEKAQDTFKALASEVLEGNNKNFLQLAETTLDKQSVIQKGELEKRHQAIEELVKPLTTSLKGYTEHMGDLEKARIKTHAYLETELKKVSEGHEALSQTTKALKDALKKPHVRGRWGEVQLKNCIELAGMSEFADVSFQDSSTVSDGKQLRPDMVVRMPGNKKVIVDCKTPIEAFLSSLETATEEHQQAEMVRHGKHVKKHIQDLSSKDYAAEVRGSADFTVMFLPNESFLYAALETQPDLMEYALQKKILIATPPTLIGLLKVIRYGWNEEQLAENAHRISEAGKELHKRVIDFMESFVNIGKHLNRAQEEYSKGQTRLESRVLVQTKKLEKLGAKSKKEIPQELSASPEPLLPEA